MREQWNMGKNFSDAQLEVAAEEAKRLSDLGHEPSEEVEVNGRKIPWDRVRRRFRREKKEEWHKYDCAFLRRSFDGKAPVQRVMFLDGSIESDVEHILMQISNYYPECLIPGRGAAASGTHGLIISKSGIDGVKATLNEGLTLLEYGRPGIGYAMIEQACDRFRDVLREAEVDLLPTLLSILCGARWRNYNKLYVYMVGYYWSMSQEVLGMKHPVTTILGIWSKAHHVRDASEPLYRKILNIIDKVHPTNLAPGVVYGLETEYLTDLSQRGDVWLARNLADAKWRQRQESLGATHPYTIMMLQMRSMLIVQERKRLVTEAEQMLLKILRLGEEQFRAEGKSWYYVYALQIGYRYYRDGRYAEAEACFKRSALWVATMLSKAGSFHLQIDRQLKSLLRLKEMGLFSPLPPGWNRILDEDGEGDEMEDLQEE
ncbi:uncharacterized protein HMPREF1120_05737 [Exophiala dermatitidis NIH/UT8656]|uniref:Clr5 domain-containing protein n=2 Tax=Exophiala dermatitidis TaxID=5970 RepID=H6C1C5_EXODN|nr:uncharacterized protein HMPREF1120_05737 [Exophiala dermatitidis NIH/UT8656]EHY57710.1 hypothetical protein HMPREF1120_05737 [Exophiala dermatitidis NIH/UT8656]